MKYVFQFCRILLLCFVGEVLHFFLPLPIPASVYGMLLLFLALKTGLLKLEQVREAGLFLTGILPMLFIPAAVGVLDVWEELRAMLLPVILALFVVTVLVMAASGLVTEFVAGRREGKHHG